MTTVEFGIDTAHFSPHIGLESRPALRGQWGARESDLVIGSVAGTAHHKSWTTIAAAPARRHAEAAFALETVLSEIEGVSERVLRARGAAR